MEMLFFLIGSGFLGVFSLVSWITVQVIRKRKRKSKELLHDFPGPDSHKLMGNTSEVEYPAVQDAFYDWASIHGLLYRVGWGIDEDMLICGDPVIAQHLLLHSKPPETWLYRETVNAFGVPSNTALETVDTASQDHPSGVENWIPVEFIEEHHFKVVLATKELLSAWKAERNSAGDIVIPNMQQGSMGLSLDVICLTCLTCDSRLRLSKEHATPVGKLLRSALEELEERSMQPFRRMSHPWESMKLGYRAWRLKSTLNAIVKERKRRLSAPTATHGPPKDVIDILLESDPSISNSAVLQEIISLFMLGSQTIANTLTWTLYHLGKDQVLQTRIREQIDEYLGLNDFPSSDQVAALTILDSTLRETLRLHSVGGGSLVRVDKDVHLDAFSVREGTLVYINTYIMGRHAGMWKNPEEFNVDRWSEEGQFQDPSVQVRRYYPFLSRNQQLFGERFGFPVLKTVLAMMLKLYYVDLQEELDASPWAKQSYTIRSLEPVSLVFRERSRHDHA